MSARWPFVFRSNFGSVPKNRYWQLPAPRRRNAAIKTSGCSIRRLARTARFRRSFRIRILRSDLGVPRTGSLERLERSNDPIEGAPRGLCQTCIVVSVVADRLMRICPSQMTVRSVSRHLIRPYWLLMKVSECPPAINRCAPESANLEP